MAKPVFQGPEGHAYARSVGANTASDGSGTLLSFTKVDGSTFEGGVDGTRLKKITVKNSQIIPLISSVMVVRVFLTDNAGANPRLWKEYQLPAATRAAGIIGADIEIPLDKDIESGVEPKIIQSVFATVADQNDFILEFADLQTNV